MKNEKRKSTIAEQMKEEWNTEKEIINKKGVKLTSPVAGGACPPSPGVGLAGLC